MLLSNTIRIQSLRLFTSTASVGIDNLAWTRSDAQHLVYGNSSLSRLVDRLWLVYRMQPYLTSNIHLKVTPSSRCVPTSMAWCKVETCQPRHAFLLDLTLTNMHRTLGTYYVGVMGRAEQSSYTLELFIDEGIFTTKDVKPSFWLCQTNNNSGGLQTRRRRTRRLWRQHLPSRLGSLHF